MYILPQLGKKKKLWFILKGKLNPAQKKKTKNKKKKKLTRLAKSFHIFLGSHMDLFICYFIPKGFKDLLKK